LLREVCLRALSSFLLPVLRWRDDDDDDDNDVDDGAACEALCAAAVTWRRPSTGDGGNAGTLGAGD
jgi:hypothetical protein